MRNIIRRPENKDKIPMWEVSGSLNYSMSLNEMKDVILQKIKNMVISGNLMTEKSLSANHDRKDFYPSNSKGGRDLTRMWGASGSRWHSDSLTANR